MSDRQLTANFSASTAGFSAGTNALKQKLNELNTHMEQTKQAVKSANSEMKQYAKELETLRRETNNGATATAEQRNRMQQLRDNIARTASEIGTMRSAEQELRRQINSTNQELREQQTAAQQVQSAAASMGDVLKANLYSSAIQSAAGKLTSALQSAAQYCYNVGSSFEAGMSQVSAISGATSAELEQLTEKAKQLGASTKFTATQVAEAMNYMAMAGWDAEQMLSGIDGVMNLAAASGGDLAQTSDIVTDAITAFGLKAEDVGHFADVLAAASANANTNVSMMGETFSYCAPIAGALGFSIEDVSEAIGLMANSGVKSSMAGTALRTFFTKLSDEVKITGKNLGEVTIQTSNADGSMRSLKNILTDMRAAFSQLTDSEKSSAAESIAGKYAMTGLLTLMNAGTSDVDKLRGAIENCDGAAADMAETMQNNAAGAVTILQSALEGLGIAVYDKFSGSLQEFVNGTSDMFSQLTEQAEGGALGESLEHLSQSAGNLGAQFLDLAENALPDIVGGLADFISFIIDARDEIGAVVTAVVSFKAAMKISSIVTAAASSIRTLTAAINATTAATEGQSAAQAVLNDIMNANPVGVVIAGLSALAGVISLVVGSLDDCNDRLRSMVESSQNAASAAQDHANKAKSLEDIKKRYEEVSESTEDSTKKTEELKNIQAELNDQFPDIASGIDLVTGAFSDQIETLDTLINKFSAYSQKEAEFALAQAQNAEKESTAIQMDSGYFNLDRTNANAFATAAAKKYGTYGSDTYLLTGAAGGTGQLYFSGSYEDKIADLTAFRNELIDEYIRTDNEEFVPLINRIDAQITELQNGQAALEAAQAVVNGGNSGASGSSGSSAYSNNSYNQTIAEEERRKGERAHADYLNSTYGKGAANVDWTDISSIRKYYKYMKDTEQISDSEYYDYLEKYGNELLEEDSDDWRSLMAEIYQGRKNLTKSSSSGSSASAKDPNEEQYDSDKKYLKWRLDMGYITEEDYYASLAELRDKYLDETSDKWREATLEIHNYQKKQNQDALDDLQDQYDSAINAIDEEIKLHDREREDEDIDKKIADIDRQLEYDRLDDYSRSQLEKKKQELLDEKEETQWQREHEDLKDGLETVYTMAQEAYESGSEKLQDALTVASQVFGAIGNGATQTAAAANTVNNNVSLVMNAVAQSSEQIAQAVVRLLSSGI